ncbi:MAG TPA: ATP-binding cassette domain-containing protein [Vicinamibacterales bacterium]|nr:ATP-binding cassette domain-containing protein [Vicinamibacterales bacterium]
MLPLIRLDGVVKASTVPPLRLDRLDIHAREHLVLSGLGRDAAEMLVHLVTGAALADEGDILIDGQSTRDIATDAEWLTALDRFGLVSERAVLIDALSIESNLALPLTVSIDPIAEDLRRQVQALAEMVGLPAGRLPEKAGTLTAVERVRVHLARALAPAPAFLLLEHPTANLDGPADAAAIGDTVRQVAETRGIGWLAISEDAAFARASGGRRLALDTSGGTIRHVREPLIRRLLQRLAGS